MGIDIYMEWDNMTEEDKHAQLTGFSIEHGHVGYLREAYHGNPYVTRFLLKEAFESDDGTAEISSKVLRIRLPEALKLHIKRQKEIYNEDINFESPSAESIISFVELAEMLHKANKNPKIIASY